MWLGKMVHITNVSAVVGNKSKLNLMSGPFSEFSLVYECHVVSWVIGTFSWGL